MSRLNQRAFEILKAEILRCSADDPVGKVQRDIALRRLERFQAKPGAPLTLEDLRDAIVDLFPDFSEKVLKAAVRANCPSPTANRFRLASAVLVGIVGLAGGVWILNLPYPPIRWTVARVAPLVLMPSFISMDKNYRQAIATTEQADQLVNRATSAADLELGTTKVQTAQKSLDALPVWFLGYYPQTYCGLFQCSWRFTLDEFQGARKEVARMDAKLFQEKNAQTQLNQADQLLGSAKQQYQEAPNTAEQQAAIAQWQQAIDQLHQIPDQTLAARMARPKLMAYERDFQQVSGLALGSTQTSNLIEAAKIFAKTAQELDLKVPHAEIEWEENQKQWATAIDRLKTIDFKDPDYRQAQTLLANYEKRFSYVQIRLKTEQASAQAFKEAQQLRNYLLDSTANNAKALNPDQARQLHRIADKLREVKAGTTVYVDARGMLKAAEARLK
ncbi:hypothetical protein H6F76_12225 [Leptolyngbya sp. FACHB-321]|uniref:hypothetical protein n=1 Tax=Leptolyngbya sp. FACHB-321 TaxID=2692807 RepID=UPI0016871A94|nr:hypothetical protein [Leptolyngbya sp. FACHB-321]MBD2035786.1 hypothetical protein [Leptolyngbya sp. FACHB-321]